jgi:hypothetical protein
MRDHGISREAGQQSPRGHIHVDATLGRRKVAIRLRKLWGHRGHLVAMQKKFVMAGNAR